MYVQSKSIMISLSLSKLELYGIMERKQSSGFRCIFTVAFLLFVAPAGALTLRCQFPNHAAKLLTFT